MLEEAHAGDPGNVDLAVALAALQLRGVQMDWYSPADSAAARSNAKSLLERVLRTEPSSIPALDAYCRLLTATNQFTEGLVTCAKALSFDPWDGMALYDMGLGQLQLGRFDDALASFRQADRFDTPEVSRWTWQLGAGMTYLVMGRSEDALNWLQRSIAITPASGRPYLLLAVACQRLGRLSEAKEAIAKAMALRPSSTAVNVLLPTLNASQAYLEAARKIIRDMIQLGLPEG